MGSKTRTGKVDRNVFSADDFSGLLGFVNSVKTEAPFALTGFSDRDEAKQVGVSLITIADSLGVEYSCRATKDKGSDTYNLNCKLVS